MPFHQTYAGMKQPAIGCLIRKIWRTLKLTQEKFAAQPGVAFLTINRWENERVRPSLLPLKQVNSLLQQLSRSPDLTRCELSQDLPTKYFLQRK